MVTLRFCQLDTDSDMPLGVAEALLAADEIARAARFRFDRDRHRYIRARGFLRRTLGDVTEQAPESLTFTYSTTGKPALVDGPMFNLSHSGDRGVVAIGDRAPVGVDIEQIGRPFQDMEGLAKRCFTAPERRAIDTAPDPLRQFLIFWTAKEARMKLTGEGLGLDPQDIHLVLDDTGQPTGFSAPEAPNAVVTCFADTGIVGAYAEEVSS